MRYNVLWKGLPSQGTFTIDLPSYFSNCKYIKIKLKEIYTKFSAYHELYLTCDAVSYNRNINLSQMIEYNYAIDLSKFLRGGSHHSSFVIPYKKNVNFTLRHWRNNNVSNTNSIIILNFEFSQVK